MFKKASLFILVTLFLAVVSVHYVEGKEYPTKSIEILSPYPPGSSTDLTCRMIADVAQKYFGYPMVVINKPGAGGTLAAAEVISSNADGYKLVMLINLFFATTTKTQKVPFDPHDLVPLANFLEVKHGFAVRYDCPWGTLNELLDYGKKNPGKLRWAHLGRGVLPHLYGTLLFKKAGVEAIDVPYKGAPECLSSVLGGHVDATINSHAAATSLLKARKIRYLTVFSERRYSDVPDAPSLVEVGFRELADFCPLMSMYIHKNTSEEIKNNLMNLFRKIYENPEFQKDMEKIGEIPRFGGPEFVIDSIRKSEKVGVPIIKELGLYVDQK